MNWSGSTTFDDFQGAPEKIFLDAGNVGQADHEMHCAINFVNPEKADVLTKSHSILGSCTTAIDHLEAELDHQINRSNQLRQSTLSPVFFRSFLKTSPIKTYE